MIPARNLLAKAARNWLSPRSWQCPLCALTPTEPRCAALEGAGHRFLTGVAVTPDGVCAALGRVLAHGQRLINGKGSGAGGEVGPNRGQ